jgi:pimeloyl-ACP methyl ester carboxylesterase
MKPTIVLVHAAFADGSSWDRVIERLQRQGYTVEARRSRFGASALTPHTWRASSSRSMVRCCWSGTPTAGRSSAMRPPRSTTSSASSSLRRSRRTPTKSSAMSRPESKDSILMTAQVQRTYPTGKDGETAPEFLIDPAKLREVFAADIPEERTAVMAATQRPVAAAAFTDRSGPPAWKSLPSWAVVATADKAAGTDLVRSMARRAGAETTEIESSHVVMISQPQAVADVIVKAARAVAASDR